jgi:hypothetical protein
MLRSLFCNLRSEGQVETFLQNLAASNTYLDWWAARSSPGCTHTDYICTVYNAPYACQGSHPGGIVKPCPLRHDRLLEGALFLQAFCLLPTHGTGNHFAGNGKLRSPDAPLVQAS